MSEKNSEERKKMLATRRLMQRNAKATHPVRMEGKYIPAGPLKNTKPENR